MERAYRKLKEIVTPYIEDYYSDFKEIGKAETYQIYEAKSRRNQEIHTIRFLDVDNARNYEQAIQLFIQELLQLCCLYPQTVLIETFEIKEKKIAIATRPCTPLEFKLKSVPLSEKDDKSKIANAKKFIMSLTTEVDFLREKMKLQIDSRFLDTKNIFIEEERGEFILGNWASLPESANPSRMLQTTLADSTDVAENIKMIGYLVLELSGVPKEDLETLENLKCVALFDSAIDGFISGNFNQSVTVKRLVRRMLNKDPKQRPSSSEIISDLTTCIQDNHTKNIHLGSKEWVQTSDLSTKLKIIITEEELAKKDQLISIIKDEEEKKTEITQSFHQTIEYLIPKEEKFTKGLLQQYSEWNPFETKNEWDVYEGTNKQDQGITDKTVSKPDSEEPIQQICIESDRWKISEFNLKSTIMRNLKYTIVNDPSHDIALFLDDVKKEEYDFLLQLITVLLNSSDHVSSPEAKFRLVYLLKTIAFQGKSQQNFVESLASQDNLLQTLVRIALFHKDLPFPQKGQGFFTSWPQSEKEIQRNIAIANNLIGLSLELLKFFAESAPQSIFTAIFEELCKRFDYGYPDLKVYRGDMTARMQWGTWISGKEKDQMRKIDVCFGKGENKVIENEAREEIEKLKSGLNNLEKISEELDSSSLLREIQNLLYNLVNCQIFGIKIKKLLNRFPLLEMNKKKSELFLEAHDLVQTADDFVQSFFGLAIKEEKECLEGLSKLINPRFEVEDGQKEPKKSNQNKGVESVSILPEVNKKKSVSKNLKFSMVDEGVGNKYQPKEKYEEEKSKAEITQSLTFLTQEYQIKQKLEEYSEIIPKELLQEYSEWYLIATNTEWNIYEGTSKQNQLITILATINKSKFPSKRAIIEFNQEIRYRESIRHPKVAPLLNFGKPPESEYLWFTEIKKRNIDSKCFNNHNFDFVCFFREIVKFMIDFRNNCRLIFENLTSEDILIDDRRNLWVKNWFKASEYVDEKQESKALESLGNCIVEIFDESKKMDLYAAPSKLLNESKALKNVLTNEFDKNIEILKKCVEAVERQINFEILYGMVESGSEEISKSDFDKLVTLPHFLAFDSTNQRVSILNEKDSPVNFSFKDRKETSSPPNIVCKRPGLPFIAAAKICKNEIVIGLWQDKFYTLVEEIRLKLGSDKILKKYDFTFSLDGSFIALAFDGNLLVFASTFSPGGNEPLIKKKISNLNF